MKKIAILVVTCALILSSCGGGEGKQTKPEPQPQPQPIVNVEEVKGVDSVKTFVTPEGKEVQIPVVTIAEGHEVIQGDIILPKKLDNTIQSQSVYIPWDYASMLPKISENGKQYYGIPIVIKSDFSHPEYLEDLKAELSKKGLNQFKFIPYTGSGGPNDTYLILEKSNSGCAANVGFLKGSPTTISMNEWCDKGAFFHEFGHIMGMIHTQSDTQCIATGQLKVIEENVDPSKLFNFVKWPFLPKEISNGCDLSSIMAYHKKAFAKAPGLITTQTDYPNLGQREGYSVDDVAYINMKFPAISNTVQCVVEKITISGVVTLDYGKTAKLIATPTFGPQGCVGVPNTDIMWSSNSPELISISQDGTIVALKDGVSSVITARIGDAAASQTISVPQLQSVDITKETATQLIFNSIACQSFTNALCYVSKGSIGDGKEFNFAISNPQPSKLRACLKVVNSIYMNTISPSAIIELMPGVNNFKVNTTGSASAKNIVNPYIYPLSYCQGDNLQSILNSFSFYQVP